MSGSYKEISETRSLSLPLFPNLNANYRRYLTINGLHPLLVGFDQTSDELLSPIELTGKEVNMSSNDGCASQDALLPVSNIRANIIWGKVIRTPFNNAGSSGETHTSLLFMPVHGVNWERNRQPSTPDPYSTSYIDQSIHKLPLEILQRIFSYMMPLQTEWNIDTPWPLPKQDDTPLALRTVCRAWNEAAFVQFLWSSIAWSVCMPTKPDSKARLAWISSFLGLTNGAPMNHFSYEIGSAPLTPNSWEMMGAVSRLMSNCRALRVVLPEWYAVDLDDLPTHPDLVADMPHLRVLSWTSPHFIETTLPTEWRLPWTKLTEAPWEQLTALFLICPLIIGDCVNVLAWCPELQTVEFNGVLEAIQPDVNLGHTAFFRHALTSLKVCSSTGVDQLFDDVEFPNLNHLHLDLFYRVGRLQDLSLRWNQLKTIFLECPLDLVDAYQLFQQCHVVTKIQWHWPSDMECSLPRNALLRSPSLELPLLESLTITPSLPAHNIKSLVNLLVTQKTPNLANFFAPFLPEKFPYSEYLATVVLTSTPVTIQECISVIASSSNLQHLDVIIWETGSTKHLKTVTSDLTSFIIRTMLQNLQPLLDCLVLPSLASLQLLSQPHECGPTSTTGELDWTGTRNYSNGPQQQGILAFFMRCMPGGNTLLRNLTLQDINIEEEEMKHILQITADCKADTHIKANLINRKMNTSHSLVISRTY